MSVFMSLMLLLSNITTTESPVGFIQKGKASFYSKKFHGRKTAGGERVNNEAFSAAHRTLPFNTMVEITNLGNNRSVVVRINDRGPFCKGRVVDMTYAAAKAIGMVRQGVANVKLRVVGSNGMIAVASPTAVPSTTAQLESSLEPTNRH